MHRRIDLSAKYTMRVIEHMSLGDVDNPAIKHIVADTAWKTRHASRDATRALLAAYYFERGYKRNKLN